jgi:hypothetical protein
MRYLSTFTASFTLCMTCLSTIPIYAQDVAVSRGIFQDADGQHRGSGTAQIVDRTSGPDVVTFENFEVTDGPALEVWLTAANDPQNASDVLQSNWISLGTLTASRGDQSYEIPEGTDLAAYGSVIIWCEQFSVLFSVASLSGL